MDFREATKRLKDSITDSQIAEELDVSVQSIRQARVERTSRSHRSPPAKWREALIRLSERRREQLHQLEDDLRASNDRAAHTED